MITSIVVNGTHKIGMNSNKKIKLGENLLSIEKDIPFIRYRFDEYSQKEYNYIVDTMKQFSFSTHLAEIKLSEKTPEILNYLINNIKSIAKYVYIDINDDEVLNSKLSEDKIKLIDMLAGIEIDRIMIKDKSTTLDTVTTKKIINDLSKRLGLDSKTFGVCSSPLSFGELACLTAVKARELMSVYSAIPDVALPTANHQCMNCCGCIRYIEVTSDIEAPLDKKVKNTKEKSISNKEKTDEVQKTAKVVKATKQKTFFGMNSL